MGLLDRMQVNVFEVVSRPCTDDRITMPHLTVSPKHKLSSVEQLVKRTKNMLEYILHNISIVDLLFLHGSCFSMSFKVIFQRNGKKGNKDACNIRRL
jgi:hypothetical protein